MLLTTLLLLLLLLLLYYYYCPCGSGVTERRQEAGVNEEGDGEEDDEEEEDEEDRVERVVLRNREGSAADEGKKITSKSKTLTLT